MFLMEKNEILTIFYFFSKIVFFDSMNFQKIIESKNTISEKLKKQQNLQNENSKNVILYQNWAKFDPRA